ncbi:MAG: sulfate adenylyltransferase [Nitrososphaerota archaeon]|nr:sulfate adenylyltransferase [Nitrososphaerota archaeon]
MIPEPYGGRLVNGLLGEREAGRLLDDRSVPSLDLPPEQVYDAEKIATGAYSPLEGFMGPQDLESVMEADRLSSGLPWTVPIVLTPRAGADDLSPGDRALLKGTDGRPFAVVDVEEKYPFDRSRFAQKVFGTTDPAHPNVADLQGWGGSAIGGRVGLLRRLELPTSRFELTPAETREYFARMGWKSVAAYQARNPPHTAHEYIQRLTLEREDVDAILVQPIVGKLKKGDYRPEIIMKAYETFVANYYPRDRVLLAALSIAMRYAGPKAVLFYAIVRRNYGCSHYIVGRDQAGVGGYYDPYAAHRIFDRYDVGVVPLRYMETFFCRVCGWMASSKVCPHPKEQHIDTSQTGIRKRLAEGKPLPTEILRPEVAEVLRGGDVFVT